MKREGVLQSAVDAREALQRKVSEQELAVERLLDTLEAKLQVGVHWVCEMCSG